MPGNSYTRVSQAASEWYRTLYGKISIRVTYFTDKWSQFFKLDFPLFKKGCYSKWRTAGRCVGRRQWDINVESTSFEISWMHASPYLGPMCVRHKVLFVGDQVNWTMSPNHKALLLQVWLNLFSLYNRTRCFLFQLLQWPILPLWQQKTLHALQNREMIGTSL